MAVNIWGTYYEGVGEGLALGFALLWDGFWVEEADELAREEGGAGSGRCRARITYSYVRGEEGHIWKNDMWGNHGWALGKPIST